MSSHTGNFSTSFPGSLSSAFLVAGVVAGDRRWLIVIGREAEEREPGNEIGKVTPLVRSTQFWGAEPTYL